MEREKRKSESKNIWVPHGGDTSILQGAHSSNTKFQIVAVMLE
jgi:hypothetical protein